MADINELLSKPAQSVFDELLTELTKPPEKNNYVPDVNVDENYNEFYGKHKVLERKDKIVGQTGQTKIVPVVKLVTTFQKKIVNIAKGFIFGKPVTYIQKSDDIKTGKAFKLLNSVLDENKTEYKDRNIAETVMIETRCAELWTVSFDSKDVKTVKFILLSKKTGNEIYPYFDNTGNMVAFTRKFKINGIQYIEIYTALKIIKAVSKTGSWDILEIPNPFKKIPVVYYEQEETEWADVQTLIDRMEDLLSRHGDTNDYNGAPMLKVHGKITSLPEKTQDGKVLQFEGEETGPDGKLQYGDASYLTWDKSPESIKLEMDNLKELIYSLSSTPNLSFNNLHGIGNVAGISIKLMFLDSIIKAANKEEIYGQGLLRRVNILKAILSMTDNSLARQFEELKVGIKFNSIIPENEKEIIEMLSTAAGGEPIISQETAVRNNPLVENAEDEIVKLEQSKTENNLQGTFNL